MFHSRFKTHILLALAFWVGGFSLKTNAQIPTIEVSALSRQAAQVGSTVDVRALGGRLDELDALISSSPGMSATMKTTAPRLLADEPTRTGVFQVAVAADARAGLLDVRAHGRFGLSNPRRFLLTSKAIELPPSEHSNAATPMELPVNAIVNDRCLPQKRNYYHLTLAAGEQLNCVAYSKQIDSNSSLSMFLLDASERELAHSRAIGDWPSEIQYVAEEAQEVFVVVHDLLFLGGDDFVYLLESAISKVGDPPPSLELNELLRPSNALLALTAETAQSEVDGDATVASPPFSRRGSFGSEPYYCEFKAKAQQQLSIRVRSAELGELTDPSIVIYKLDAASGNASQLVHQDDAPPLGGPAVRMLRPDPWLQWTAPEDATYRILVHDNQSGLRPSDAVQFILSVDDVRPRFRLLAYHPFPSNNPAGSRPMGTQLLRASTNPIQVVAIREEGFADSIEVAVEGLPAGVTCQNAVMPAGGTDATLILRCTEDAAAWHGELKIVGRAKLGDQPIEVLAETVTISNAATTTKNAIRHRATERLFDTINATDIAPLLVELGDGTVIDVAQGAKATLQIKATRREGGKAECTLRPQHLPPKSSLAETKIPADQSDVTAELTVAADAPLGEFTFWMQNETKIKMRPNPQVLEREEAYLAKLKSAVETAADDQKPKLNEAITSVSAAIEELKKQTAEQEFTVWLATTPQRIRITAKP